MICVKELSQGESVAKRSVETLVKLVAPLAPHQRGALAELGHTGSIVKAGWPEYDLRQLTVNSVKSFSKSTVNIGVTLRCLPIFLKTLPLPPRSQTSACGNFIEGKEIKEIYVPGKIVNIVAV